MDSSSSSSSSSASEHAKVVPKQCDIFNAVKYFSSRRTHSFSSSSSSLSPSSSSFESFCYFHEDPLLSPASPLRFSSVPFSWERLPGIPKKQNSKSKLQESPSLKLLPLPPPTTTHTSKKHNRDDTRVRNKKSSVFQRDPFFAALVECSKDDHHHHGETSTNLWNGAKVPRSITDRFGFINLYASCKRTCAVSESLVYLPSSGRSSCEHVSPPRSL